MTTRRTAQRSPSANPLDGFAEPAGHGAGPQAGDGLPVVVSYKKKKSPPQPDPEPKGRR